MTTEKSGRNPVAAREGRRHIAKPHLEHGAVEQHRDRQHQADPEAIAEHLLVAGVIDVAGHDPLGGALPGRLSPPVECPMC